MVEKKKPKKVKQQFGLIDETVSHNSQQFNERKRLLSNDFFSIHFSCFIYCWFSKKKKSRSQGDNVSPCDFSQLQNHHYIIQRIYFYICSI